MSAEDSKAPPLGDLGEPASEVKVTMEDGEGQTECVGVGDESHLCADTQSEGGEDRGGDKSSDIREHSELDTVISMSQNGLGSRQISRDEDEKGKEKKWSSWRQSSVSSDKYTFYGNGGVPEVDFKLVTRSMSMPASELLADPNASPLGVRHRIRMEEVAPIASSIIDEEVDWRQQLQPFSDKKKEKGDVKHLPKRVRRYYKTQDELITAFEELHLEVDDAMDASDKAKRTLRIATIMAQVSFGLNLLLLVVKIVAAVLSGSLAVVSAVVDSAVDLVSGGLMWWSNRAVKNRNIYRYPQGRTKLEPVSIVMVSVVMALASVQMIRESVEKIIDYVNHAASPPIFEWPTIAICVFTVVTKLVLFLICRRINNPTTQTLATDHRNDVASNSMALICGYIGYKWWAYADPIGAIIICVYIIGSWFVTGQEQIKMLTGHTARPDFLKKLTWIAVNHHNEIQKIETVRAFHFGNNFLAEVDIVLPEIMSLKEAHNIGESLQQKIEKLPEVERAFVHLDYEFEHDPALEHKSV